MPPHSPASYRCRWVCIRKKTKAMSNYALMPHKKLIAPPPPPPPYTHPRGKGKHISSCHDSWAREVPMRPSRFPWCVFHICPVTHWQIRMENDENRLGWNHISLSGEKSPGEKEEIAADSAAYCVATRGCNILCSILCNILQYIMQYIVLQPGAMHQQQKLQYIVKVVSCLVKCKSNAVNYSGTRQRNSDLKA